MKPGKFLSQGEAEQVVNAIKEAELNTSGEIRVHIEGKIKGDVLDRAAYIFKTLNMHRTKERNGVLFYLAEKSKKFAILGDAGINEKVPDDFWEKVRETMETQFRDNHFGEGLSQGILMAGEKLKKFFPHQKDDVNELSDDISYGKN